MAFWYFPIVKELQNLVRHGGTAIRMNAIVSSGIFYVLMKLGGLLGAIQIAVLVYSTVS